MQPTKALVSLRYVTRIVAVIILIMVAVGFFLPSDYKIERSVVVDRENQSELLKRLYSVNAWPNWLYIQDGQLQQAETSGARLSKGTQFDIRYVSKPDKRGSLTVQSVSNAKIDFIVTPNQNVKPIANVMELTTQAEGITVTWVVEGELDAGFLSPYLALVANSIAGSNLEKSLAALVQY